MKNVVDLVKFANGFLGRYALGRLIGMIYQVRIGMIVAGAYGQHSLLMPINNNNFFIWYNYVKVFLC